MRRELEIGTRRFTRVCATDEPGEGGASHRYEVDTLDDEGRPFLVGVADVHFQKGAIQEHGVNGCHNEDLIAIVIDRLRGFQMGEFCCRENALALTKLEEALHWLNHRTAERVRRGVEGRTVP